MFSSVSPPAESAESAETVECEAPRQKAPRKARKRCRCAEDDAENAEEQRCLGESLMAAS